MGVEDISKRRTVVSNQMSCSPASPALSVLQTWTSIITLLSTAIMSQCSLKKFETVLKDDYVWIRKEQARLFNGQFHFNN